MIVPATAQIPLKHFMRTPGRCEEVQSFHRPLGRIAALARLCSLAACLVSAGLTGAEGAARSAIGLPRLKEPTRQGGPARLADAKFAIDDLAAVGPAVRAERDDVAVLVLAAGSEWKRPLRGSPRAVSFISFQVYASGNTIIEAGGARLGFTVSPIDGSLQLMFDDSTQGSLQWRPLRLNVDTAKFDGKNLSMFPTLTLRLDPEENTWDLYTGSRLTADSLPLIAEKKMQREFVMRAGAEGAWVTGLVMADENPLYDDQNANGIDDGFEKEKRGALLGSNTQADRRVLAEQWRDAQRRKSMPLHERRPMQDGATSKK